MAGLAWAAGGAAPGGGLLILTGGPAFFFGIRGPLSGLTESLSVREGPTAPSTSAVAPSTATSFECTRGREAASPTGRASASRAGTFTLGAAAFTTPAEWALIKIGR